MSKDKHKSQDEVTPETEARVDWMVNQLILEDEYFARMFIAPGNSESVTDAEVEALRAKVRARTQ